ncbi:TIGR04086 family membrane protein [Effusibacillus dendaii]|uniref:Membrane protein n=1 Tax=Effusibacillus dendaii TaxID=2743772 RepID=A0A7I8DHN3_9BACL|nr:TIGR04086 family membrane protein [Effusibacillus dendaii]BCJ88130.1 membrane protein [Effusibacillus dendaii]
MKGKSISDIAPRFGGTPILTGLLYALIIAFGAVILSAMTITWTAIPESKLPVITYIINVAAALIGSFTAARKAGERGWYYGGITGLIYSVLITILGLMLVSAAFTLHNVVQIAILSAIGGLGGVIGVNSQAK